MPHSPTLASLAADLDSGITSARKLVEECLARIADPAGEGARAFIHVDRDAALRAACSSGTARPNRPAVPAKAIKRAGVDMLRAYLPFRKCANAEH